MLVTRAYNKAEKTYLQVNFELVNFDNCEFCDLPNTLKPSTQVEVAHSRLRTTSGLVMCFPVDASPFQQDSRNNRKQDTGQHKNRI